MALECTLVNQCQQSLLQPWTHFFEKVACFVDAGGERLFLSCEKRQLEECGFKFAGVALAQLAARFVANKVEHVFYIVPRFAAICCANTFIANLPDFRGPPSVSSHFSPNDISDVVEGLLGLIPERLGHVGLVLFLAG